MPIANANMMTQKKSGQSEDSKLSIHTPNQMAKKTSVLTGMRRATTLRRGKTMVKAKPTTRKGKLQIYDYSYVLLGGWEDRDIILEERIFKFTKQDE